MTDYSITSKQSFPLNQEVSQSEAKNLTKSENSPILTPDIAREARTSLKSEAFRGPEEKSSFLSSIGHIFLGILTLTPVIGFFINLYLDYNFSKNLKKECVELINSGKFDEAIGLINKNMPEKKGLYENNQIERAQIFKDIYQVIDIIDPPKAQAFAEKSPKEFQEIMLQNKTINYENIH